MNNSLRLNKILPTSPFWLIAFWSSLLLVSFIPTIPQPASTIGYLWQVEFALAGLIFLTLIVAPVFRKNEIYLVNISRLEILCVILPLVLFTVWSGLSVIWAQSWHNALHHTLLWACYLLFYVLIRQITAQPQLLSVSFKVTGVIIFALGMACFVEYAVGSSLQNDFFKIRYYKYAEAFVTLLPLFLAFALHRKSRISVLSAGVALAAWLVVLLSLSRTMLISGIVCIGFFFALILFFQNWQNHLKKSLPLVILLVILACLTQITFSPEQETTFNRLTGYGEINQNSYNLRFLYWGISLELFKQNPLLGVGADNYLSNYKTAREEFSTLNDENKILEIHEDILPERTHNEYLQILSELGVVGIALFIWMIGGIFYLFLSMRKNRVSLLSIASLSGITAFLISSLASSYSFRVPANGLCFFFMLALGAQSLMKERQAAERNSILDFPKLKPHFVVFGLIICSAMLIFSAVRGVSLMYLAKSLNTSDKAEAEENILKAIALDKEDGSFRFYYGSQLYIQSLTEESIPQMRLAIDQGIATSNAYFTLATAQIISDRNVEAEETFNEALRVYPRSVFLRTAYASFLGKNGKDSQAAAEYEKALSINQKQAKSWYLAHNDGLNRLSITERLDKNLLEPMKLIPTNAALALMNYQNLVREKSNENRKIEELKKVSPSSNF